MSQARVLDMRSLFWLRAAIGNVGCIRWGALIIAAFLVGCFLILELDPQKVAPSQRLQFFSFDHWLGTDGLGRDMFARVIHGGVISLAVGISVTALATIAGLSIGLMAGYFRTVDLVVMRIMDGIMAIPTLLLAIALTTLSDPSVLLVIIALAVPDVPRIVRVVRAETLSLRTRTFVTAAIASGSSTSFILGRHIVPNLLGPLSVQVTYVCAAAILHEASLSFIGAGMPAETPSWGVLIAENRQYFQRAPWVVLMPGLCLTALILAISLAGDAIRDRNDAKSKNQ